MKRKILNFDFGEFDVRITPKLIDVEASDKQWKVQFGKKTKEYAIFCYLVKKGKREDIEALTLLLFYSRLVVDDTEFRKKFTGLLGEHFKESEEKKEVTEEEDQQIIKEEEALHGE